MQFAESDVKSWYLMQGYLWGPDGAVSTNEDISIMDAAKV